MRILTSQKGNIFAMLFAAVAMTGVLGVVGMQTVSGPVTTITKVTQKNITDTDIMTNGRIMILNAATQPNADGDGEIEPMPPVACTGDAPTGGGCLPQTVGAVRTNPWGTEYGYCVWNHGVDNAAGGGLLAGKADGSGAVIAIISAGPNKTFDTGCYDYGGSPEGVSPEPGAGMQVTGTDDTAKFFTYAEAVAGAGGLWSLKAGTTDTATVGDASVTQFEIGTGSEMIRFDTTTGRGEFPSVRVDVLTGHTQDHVELAGGLRLDADAAVNCTASGILRYSTTNQTVEVCDGSGFRRLSVWEIDGSGNIFYNAGNVSTTQALTAGSLSTSGTLNAGASTLGATTVSSLNAGSGTIQTTGTLNAGTSNLGDTIIDDDLTVNQNTIIGNNLTVDTNTLFVDATNNRVGIGTVTPGRTLSVERSTPGGTASFVNTSSSNTVTVSGIGITRLTMVENSTGDSGFIQTHSVDRGLGFYAPGDLNVDLYLGNNGNVGIGTASPDSRLEVAGAIQIAAGSCGPTTEGAIQYTSANNIQYCNGSGWQNITGAVAQLRDIGNVDITTDPANGQTIVWDAATEAWIPGSPGSSGSSTTSRRLIDSGGGDTSVDVDTAGDGSDNITLFTNNGVESMRVTAAGTVGIGVTDPQSILHVNGAVQVGDDTATCDADKAGAIRYQGTSLQYCNGTAWVSTGTGGSGGGGGAFDVTWHTDTHQGGSNKTFNCPAGKKVISAWTYLSPSGSSVCGYGTTPDGGGIIYGGCGIVSGQVYQAQMACASSLGGGSGSGGATDVTTLKYCAENDNCSGTPRVCAAYVAGSDGANQPYVTVTDANSIQFGTWSNTQCGNSGTGWHANYGTCGTGAGSGHVQCRYVLVEETVSVGGGSGSGSGSGGTNATGMISAFNATSCPAGWSEYLPARGRFLRGIDSTGTIDPDGVRTPGSLQEDAFQDHMHTPQVYSGSPTSGGDWQFAPGAFTTNNDAVAYDPYPSDPAINFASYNGPGGAGLDRGFRTSSETRPKNVAVIFCQFDGTTIGGGSGSGSGGEVLQTKLTATNIPAGGYSALTTFNANLDTAEIDTLNAADLAGDQITIPQSGTYIIEATAQYCPQTTHYSNTSILLNGSQAAITNSPIANGCRYDRISEVMSLTSGDNLQLQLFNSVNGPTSGINDIMLSATLLNGGGGSGSGSGSAGVAQESEDYSDVALPMAGGWEEVFSYTNTTSGDYLILASSASKATGSYTYQSLACRLEVNGTSVATADHYDGQGTGGSTAYITHHMHEYETLNAGDVLTIDCNGSTNGSSLSSFNNRITLIPVGGGGSGSGGRDFTMGSKITANLPANMTSSGVCEMPQTASMTIPETGIYFVRGFFYGYNYTGNAREYYLDLVRNSDSTIVYSTAEGHDASNSYFFGDGSDMFELQAGDYTARIRAADASACGSTSVDRVFSAYVAATPMVGGGGSGSGSGGGSDPIGFEALVTAQSVPHATSTIIIAPQVDERGGDNYNPTTGVYTIPSDGYYQFNSSIISAAGMPANSYAILAINKSGTTLCQSYSPDSTAGNGRHDSCSASGYFIAGETISTSVYHGAGSNRDFQVRLSGFKVGSGGGSGSGSGGDVTISQNCPSGFTKIEQGDTMLGCIQTDQSAAATWAVAANTCFTTYGGRLPTTQEWYIAVNNYSLDNETGAWEWTSDAVGESAPYENHAVIGGTSISDVSWNYDTQSHDYRCFIPAGANITVSGGGSGSGSSSGVPASYGVAEKTGNVNVPSGGTIVTINNFDTVNQEGTEFDASTGLLQPTEAGVYVVSASVYGASANDLTLSVCKEGTAQVCMTGNTVVHTGAGWHATATNVVHLDGSNDYVRVILQGYGGSTETISSTRVSWSKVNAGGGSGSGSGSGTPGGKGFFATVASNQTIATSSVEKAIFGTEVRDDLNAYDTTTSEFTAPEDGWYQLSAYVQWQSFFNNVLSGMQVRANGNAVCQDFGEGSSTDKMQNCSGAYYLAAGEVATVHAWHYAGSDAVIEGGSFSAVAVGSGGGSGSGSSIVGHVAADGTIESGSGFTITRISAGQYDINFNTPFSGIPIVTLGLYSNPNGVSTGTALLVPAQSTNSKVRVITMQSGGSTFTDLAFNFIAADPEGLGGGSGGSSAPDVSFSVHNNGVNFTLPANTWTKLNWSNEEYDTANSFDSGTFTPTVAGKYVVSAGAFCQSATINCAVAIMKNGTIYKYGFDQGSGGGVFNPQVTAIVDMNGTTDNLEVYAIVNGGTVIDGAVATTYFTGALLGGGGSGGGSDTLAGLSCLDGQVAAWNDGNSAWECADGGSGGGVALPICDVNDELIYIDTNRVACSSALVTWDPNNKAAQSVLSQGNLHVQAGTYGLNFPETFATKTTGTSGKFYYEVEAILFAGAGNAVFAGFDPASATPSNNGYPAHYSNYQIPSTISDGEIIMLAIDIDSGQFWYGKNGIWHGGGDPANGTNPASTFTPGTDMIPAITVAVSNTQLNKSAGLANFGATNFAYTPPTGFESLIDETKIVTTGGSGAGSGGGSDTLSQLSCTADQYVRFDGNNWVCASISNTVAPPEDENLLDNPIIPEALVCNNGTEDRFFYIYEQTRTSSRVIYYERANGHYVSFKDNGDYMHTNWASSDCAFKSLQTLDSENKTFDFNNGPETTMVSGWPDAIKCDYAAGAYDVMLHLTRIDASGNHWYYWPAGYYAAFNSSKTEYTRNINTSCNGQTIADLYTANRAFNYVGGDESRSIIKNYPDALVCESANQTEFLVMAYDYDNGTVRYDNFYGGRYIQFQQATGEFIDASPATDCNNINLKELAQSDKAINFADNSAAEPVTPIVDDGYIHEGWPDFITCENANESYVLSPAYVSGNSFIYFDYTTSISMYFDRNTKAFVSNTAAMDDTPCAGQSISQLEAAGHAQSLKGGVERSMSSSYPDMLRCSGTDGNYDMHFQFAMDNGTYIYYRYAAGGYLYLNSSDQSYYTTNYSTDCANKSLPTLISEGRAVNLVGGTDSGSIFDGFPDAIQCEYAQWPITFYYSWDYKTSNYVRYGSTGGHYIDFMKDDGAYITQNIGTTCTNHSIGQLIAEGRGVNLVDSNNESNQQRGYASSGSMIRDFPDFLVCPGTSTNQTLIYRIGYQNTSGISYVGAMNGIDSQHVMTFGPGGAFVSGGTNTICNGQSIDDLITFGQAFNLGGGSGGGSDNLGDHTATEAVDLATFKLVGNGGTDGLSIDASGNVTIDGDVTAASYLHSSDLRLKDDIQTVDDPFATLAPIEGKRYIWKKDGTGAYGVIAQDVEKTMPEAVSTNDVTGMKAVDYDQLIAPVINAVKWLKDKVDGLIDAVAGLVDRTEALEAENAALRDEIKTLQDQNAEILRRLEALEGKNE